MVYLSKLSNKHNSTLIHFSTDYVFDGLKNNKYNEEDKTKPISKYGISKQKGEQVIINNCNNYIIFRISWLFSEFNKNFVKFVIDQLKKNKDIYAVNDLFSIPTCSDDICLLLQHVIKENLYKHKKCLYHSVNNGEIISWYDFAREIMRIYSSYYKTKSNIISVSSKNFFKNNIRPKYSAMDNNKLNNELNFQFANWKNSLKKTIENILHI